uniref:NADH dehydrogenase [ubiquinone] 1 beta subcomplex subunit 10 n=1 Tax=Attheya septentrionalis TaxID=420275 RepID=A0A7S2UB87_9STRA
MTSMYDEPKVMAGTLPPYPHEERGSEFGRAKDPVKFLQAVEQRARERQVAYETVRLLRQDVITCFRKEGVNHYENCKEETEKYYKIIIKKDVGQLQPNWENKEKNEGW